MLNTDMGLMWNFQVSIITEKLRTNDTFALSPGEQEDRPSSADWAGQ